MAGPSVNMDSCWWAFWIDTNNRQSSAWMSWVEAFRGDCWPSTPQTPREGMVMANWRGFGSLHGRSLRFLDHRMHLRQEFPGQCDGLHCLSCPYAT